MEGAFDTGDIDGEKVLAAINRGVQADLEEERDTVVDDEGGRAAILHTQTAYLP